jgi:hypothetical protein
MNLILLYYLVVMNGKKPTSQKQQPGQHQFCMTEIIYFKNLFCDCHFFLVFAI